MCVLKVVVRSVKLPKGNSCASITDKFRLFPYHFSLIYQELALFEYEINKTLALVHENEIYIDGYC